MEDALHLAVNVAEVRHIPAYASLAGRLDCGRPEVIGVKRDDAWAKPRGEMYESNQSTLLII